MHFDGISQFVDTFVQSHVKFHMCGFEPAPTPNSGICAVFLNQEALNEREVQKSGQLRKKDEHPTVVKGAQDHSDKKHFDLETKKKITEEKPMAPNQHSMKLRKRR